MVLDVIDIVGKNLPITKLLRKSDCSFIGNRGLASYSKKGSACFVNSGKLFPIVTDIYLG